MQIRKILITGRIYQELAEKIGKLPDVEILALPEQEVTKEILHEVDGLVAFQPPPNFVVGNIKWIHSLGAGVDKFVEALHHNDQVVLTRTVGPFGRKISQYCLQYILWELQQVKSTQAAQCKKEWQPITPVQLDEVTVVILGTGEIGTVIAQDLSYFGVEVYGVSRSGEQKIGFKEVFSIEDSNPIWGKAHFVINTLPLTVHTKGLLDDTFFKRLNSCNFINVGRGATVEEEALKRALEKGNLQQGILDVFSIEPLPKDCWMWNHSKITITPHIAAITSIEDACKSFLETYATLQCGNTIQNTVDFSQGY